MRNMPLSNFLKLVILNFSFQYNITTEIYYSYLDLNLIFVTTHLTLLGPVSPQL